MKQNDIRQTGRPAACAQLIIVCWGGWRRAVWVLEVGAPHMGGTAGSKVRVLEEKTYS